MKTLNAIKMKVVESWAFAKAMGSMKGHVNPEQLVDQFGAVVILLVILLLIIFFLINAGTGTLPAGSQGANALNNVASNVATGVSTNISGVIQIFFVGIIVVVAVLVYRLYKGTRGQNRY